MDGIVLDVLVQVMIQMLGVQMEQLKTVMVLVSAGLNLGLVMASLIVKISNMGLI
jgi:hypothetical protein